MTSRDFCYWFQGFLEVANPETLNKEQVSMIQRHLNLVFVHEIDPSFGSKDKQDTLNTIHFDGSKMGQKLPGGVIARC